MIENKNERGKTFLLLFFCGVGDENFLLIEMGGKTFCFFSFAALSMKKLSADRDEGQNFLLLFFCGIADEKTFCR